MTISSVTTQNVTTVSGAAAIVSASASTEALIPSSASQIPAIVEVIGWSDYITAFSVLIMLLSFLWGIYSSKTKSNLIAKENALKERLAFAQEEANKIEREKLQLQIDLMNGSNDGGDLSNACCEAPRK